MKIPSTPEELEGSAAEFFASVRDESDRGSVLVSAAFLDESLEALLRSRMSLDPVVARLAVDRLFGAQGPLGSFSAKIALCRALDLVDESEYADLNRVRRLRNPFAHSHTKVTFEDQQAKDIVGGFSIFEDIQWVDDPAKKDGVPSARKQFIFAASWLAGSLHHKIKKR